LPGKKELLRIGERLEASFFSTGMFPDALRKMIKQLEGRRGNVIVVGIGHGPEVPRLNRIRINNDQIVGVDISEEKLRLLREKFPDVKSFKSLKEVKDNFDAVMVSPGVIKETEDGKILQEIKKYIKKAKPRGRILIDLNRYDSELDELKKLGFIMETKKGIIKDAGTQGKFMLDLESGSGNKWVKFFMKRGFSKEEAEGIIREKSVKLTPGIRMMIETARDLENLSESEARDVLEATFEEKSKTEKYQRLFERRELEELLKKIEGLRVKRVIPAKDCRWVISLDV